MAVKTGCDSTANETGRFNRDARCALVDATLTPLEYTPGASPADAANSVNDPGAVMFAVPVVGETNSQPVCGVAAHVTVTTLPVATGTGTV